MTIPEVMLAGQPRDRGRVYGESCRELIAEGAEQRVETMFAWQLIDECWWYLDERTGSLEPHEACSSLAINSGGRGIVAQTQDLYRHLDGSQIMLRYIERDGLEILAPSAAGLLAYNGVNSAGLAVCITTLSELAHASNGLSSGFVVPTLLRCRTIDDALAWLERTPMASGNSWTLGTRDRSVVVEASADGVVVLDDHRARRQPTLPRRRGPARHGGAAQLHDVGRSRRTASSERPTFPKGTMTWP